MIEAKSWTFSAKTMEFVARFEGTAHTEIKLIARVKSDIEFDGDTSCVETSITDVASEPKEISVKITEAVKAGDLIQAHLYADGNRCDTMSIGVTGACCPDCGYNFLI